MLSVNSITQDDARHVLYYFGKPGGWQSGSFTQSLLKLFSKADEENFEKLSNEFPGLASAYRLVTHDHQGHEILRAISMGTLKDNSYLSRGSLVFTAGGSK